MSLEHYCSNNAIEVIYRSEILGIALDNADLGAVGLLIALAEEESNLVGIELRNLSVNSSLLIEQLQSRSKQDVREPLSVFFSLFREKQRVLGETRLIRRHMGHGGTHAEHIFLSAIDQSRGVQDVLAEFGIDWKELQNRIVAQISNDPKFKPVPPESQTDTGNIYQSSYMGILIGVCFQIKSDLYDRAMKTQEHDSNLYKEAIQQLRAAAQKAASIEEKLLPAR